MRLFFIRYTKLLFISLRLHVLFNWVTSVWSNAFHLTKLSAFIHANRHVKYNDLPSKWDYTKRFQLYDWVMKEEGLEEKPISYLEFGVANGHSFKWFLERNKHADSRFFGFDTFTGLPEDWGPLKKGYFNTGNEVPVINDARGSFYQGLFQQTLPAFLTSFKSDHRNVIMMDADLYSSTLFVLSSLAPFMKKDDIIFFDEFAVPTHEFKAFMDFTQAYYKKIDLIGAANNFYFTAFKVAQ